MSPRRKDAVTASFGMEGLSGLTRYGAVSRVYEEFLKELQGPQGMKNFREMYDNDPIVGAVMYAALHLCRKVTFKFRPADDSNKAKEVADFVGGAIFDDMTQTWPDTLSEILTMLPFGWALLEFRMKRRLGMGKVDLRPPAISDVYNGVGGLGYEVPNFAPSRFDDGKIGFRDWSLRSQETLFQWEFDEDSNAVVMQQMASPDYRIRRIPLAKALLFRTQVSKNNPEGRSILRNAWTSYYFKKNLQVFEGIGIERDLAGYPVIQMEKPDIANGLAVPDIWNTQDAKMVAMLAAIQKMVRSVRRDEQEGMVLPWWAKFSLVGTGSKRNFDTNSIIGRYDQRISMSMMADFIMLGHEAVGSKALAATKISLFTSALSSFLDTAAAIISRKAVPLLLQFNGYPQELCPVMEHGNVESVNLQELGDFIQKVAGTGFNPLASPEAQKAIMDIAKLPFTVSEATRLSPTLPKAGAGGEAPKPAKDGVGDNKAGADELDPHPLDPQGNNSGGPADLVTT